MKIVNNDQDRSQKHRGECHMRSWNLAFTQARKKVASSLWEDAALKYQDALEAAEALMANHHDIMAAVKRYIRTAVEFAYALRMSHHVCDFSALVAIVKACLQNERLMTPVGCLLEPLEDVVSSPLGDVKHWMNILFAMDDIKGQSLH